MSDFVMYDLFNSSIPLNYYLLIINFYSLLSVFTGLLIAALNA
jgi:hypothetical protein